MDTRNHTVTDPSCASNAEGLLAQPVVARDQTLQLSVRYAVELTRPIVRAVTTTPGYTKAEILTIRRTNVQS